MAARLGFAVAVNVEPEILLVDEVLSVGDEAFQRKCLDRIKQFQREGRTILLVTHAVDMVRQICDRAAVLDHGDLVAVGAPGEAALAFREHLRKKGAEVPRDLDDPTLLRNLEIEITDAQVVYPDPEPVVHPPERAGRDPRRLSTPRSGSTTSCSRSRSSTRRARCCSGRTRISRATIPGSVDGRRNVRFAFERFPVLDGVYLVSIGIHSHDGGVIYDQRAEKDTVEVLSEGREVGLVHFPVAGARRGACRRPLAG